MSLNPGERLFFGDTIGEIWLSCNFHDHDKEKEEEHIDEFDAVDDSAILIIIKVAK